MYARTENKFKEDKESLFGDGTSLKYPNWKKHLEESYFNSQLRIRAWAHYIRIEEKLPTHNDNTNNYVESSFRETKDNQFERTKCFNLPDLLRTLMDHSESYKTKLADLGNNRTANYKNNKSKHLLKATKTKKEDINNIEGGNYIVREERNGKVSFYRLNMFSGFCECSRGKNCGPCDHKSSVANHFKDCGFSVIPESDPHMRAMWHYIAFGKTLGNHWYRSLHGEQNIDVEAFINKRLDSEDDEQEEENDNIDHEHQDIEGVFEINTENGVEETKLEEIMDNFKINWKKYGEKVISEMEKNNKNPNLLKAVNSASKIMMKSLNSKSETITHQLVWFGKDKHKKKVRGKVRSSINVQPTAVARSKANGAKRRGRKVTTRGRPHKNRQAELVLDDGTVYGAQEKLKKTKGRAKHSFKEALAKNVPPPRRHDRQ